MAPDFEPRLAPVAIVCVFSADLVDAAAVGAALVAEARGSKLVVAVPQRKVVATIAPSGGLLL